MNYYCSSGRISGAVKMGTVWLIPRDSQKPADKRFKSTRSKEGENK
ncbi:DNA-binding protein [Clostridium sp. M62/1]